MYLKTVLKRFPNICQFKLENLSYYQSKEFEGNVNSLITINNFEHLLIALNGGEKQFLKMTQQAIKWIKKQFLYGSYQFRLLCPHATEFSYTMAVNQKYVQLPYSIYLNTLYIHSWYYY